MSNNWVVLGGMFQKDNFCSRKWQLDTQNNDMNILKDATTT